MLELTTGGRKAAADAVARADFVAMSDYALFERIQTADVVRFDCSCRGALPAALQRLAAVAEDLRAETLGWAVFDGEDADSFEGVVTRTRRELREQGLVLRAALWTEADAEGEALEVLLIAALAPGTGTGRGL